MMIVKCVASTCNELLEMAPKFLILLARDDQNNPNRASQPVGFFCPACAARGVEFVRTEMLYAYALVRS